MNTEWNKLYKRFSECLCKFYDLYKEDSGRILYKKYIKKDDNFGEITWIKNFSGYNVYSIDPIHIFASFNYWKISSKKRKERMIFFLDLLEDIEDSRNLIREISESANLDIFYNFPHINITSVVSSRSEQDRKSVV